MRPAPVAAGFQPWRGMVSSASKLGASANAARDRLSAIPLDVASLTNSRREIPMLRYLFVSATDVLLRRPCEPPYLRSAMDAAPGPGVTSVGHCLEPNGTSGGRNALVPRLVLS